MREAAARKGFAETRVLTDWEAIAGAELASLCRPVKVSYAGKGFGATLIVLADGARAPEVEMLGPRIVERVNAHYGYRAISRLKVVQTDRALSASRGSDRGVAAQGGDGPASAALSSDVRLRAARAAEGVESPELRVALERLAASWLARRHREGQGE
ncbi:MAG: DciA family protein [Paracoccaceae bacterium]